MTSRNVEASDIDLADQAMPVDNPDEDNTGIEVPAEADPADVVEQYRSVPSADDEYDR